MPLMRIAVGLIFLLGAGLAVSPYSRSPKTAPLPKVTVQRTPQGGIQPQTVLAPDGTLHMIYFRGDAAAGDIEYVRRAAGANRFSEPLRVNSEPGSAIAIGTVRGPQMSVGRRGRVCVIWFGARTAPGATENTIPVFFSRLNDAGTAFEAQRNLMRYTQGGDGGISVAADLQGDVYAVWHGLGAQPGEDHRRVYLARSTDDGKTFAREVPISPESLGACGCCGMRAFVDKTGSLYVLYRAAAQNIHRDMTLLVSTDQGTAFRTASVGPWELNACPMSTAYLSEAGRGVLAAWEKAGQVYFDPVDATSLQPHPAFSAPGDGDSRKHPAIAANSSGQVLLTWTESTGWKKGGSVAWQLFDATGKPLGKVGRATDLPAWDLPSAFADRQGNFSIFY